MSFFDRIKSGLTRTRDALSKGLEPVLETLDKLDPDAPEIHPETLDNLEEALLAADISLDASQPLIERVKRDRPRTQAEFRASLAEAVADAVRGGGERRLEAPPGIKPWVVLVIGVNGSGKTTLIGKLAERERKAGRSVLLVAADTFRAAATEQLGIWAERAHAALVSQAPGADPAAVAHDGVSAALARNIDTVLIDTAGRLHTQSDLMEEISKVKRVIGKVLPNAPHETLLVLDGTVGQNGIAQARKFHSALDLTGVAMNKLDGTSRGGIVISVAQELELPILLIGLGEGIEDLEDFEPQAFADALVRGEPEESER